MAGPLRRFGTYTIPDFAEGRFDSRNMRKMAVVFALTISFFYMMPQMKGAGITLARLLGSPYWVGVVVVGTVIAVNVILGGMKGVTLVQAFQYWVKQFAIGLGLLVENFDINMLVGWSFAIGASTYFPLLLLGSWYRNLTKAGAVAGMLGGGAGAIGSAVFSMLLDKGIAAAPAPLVGTLTAQPAIWTVPLALGLMFVVSMATKSVVPADARLKMLKLHAPEQLGLGADYIKD